MGLKATTTVCNPKFQIVQVQPELTLYFFILAEIDMVTTKCDISANYPSYEMGVTTMNNLKISA